MVRSYGNCSKGVLAPSSNHSRWLGICRLFLAAGLFVGVCSTALAADKGYVEVKTIPLYEAMKTSLKWRATAYEWNEESDRPFEQPAAKMCFWYEPVMKGQTCFLAEDQGVRYQSIEEVSLIELEKGEEPQHGVLFVTRDLSPSIGKKRLFTIWVYHKERRSFVNALPSVRLSDVSEYKMLARMKGGTHGIL
jgi:hypothetical protein